MKHLGKNLGRTLAVALLVGAGSVISAVSAQKLPRQRTRDRNTSRKLPGVIL